MNYKNFYCQLPIKDNNVKVISGIVENDTANIVHVRLMDGENPFDFTGYTQVVLEILKPDGSHINALVTDSQSVESDNNPYRIQVVEPQDGRISFSLQGQATLLTGTHFAQIQVYGNNKMLTSARINYYVGESLAEDNPDLSSFSEYASLKALIDACNTLISAVREMQGAENTRAAMEIERQAGFEEAINDVAEFIANATEYVAQGRDYMEQAALYARLAESPSAEIIGEIIEGIMEDLASKSYVENMVANETRNFDAGAYLDDEDSEKLLIVRNGAEEDIPILSTGELGFSVDTKNLYIGSQEGNIPLSGSFKAQPTPPTRTDILWIDTSQLGGNAIKFYDGTSWKATSTGNFG